jgi:hypothetical protein
VFPGIDSPFPSFATFENKSYKTYSYEKKKKSPAQGVETGFKTPRRIDENESGVVD